MEADNELYEEGFVPANVDTSRVVDDTLALCAHLGMRLALCLVLCLHRGKQPIPKRAEFDRHASEAQAELLHMNGLKVGILLLLFCGEDNTCSVFAHTAVVALLVPYYNVVSGVYSIDYMSNSVSIEFLLVFIYDQEIQKNCAESQDVVPERRLMD